MAQSKKQLDNLKRGNPDTQINCGRDAVEKQKKSVKSRAQKRKRRKSLAEAAQIAAKLPINDIGKNSLKRRGIDVDSIDPDDMVGVMALALGQMAAGINGNSQAAQVFADWLDLATKHKKEQLEIEKLKAEIDRMKMGSGMGDQDSEFLNAWKQSIIDGFRDGEE